MLAKIDPNYQYQNNSHEPSKRINITISSKYPTNVDQDFFDNEENQGNFTQ